MIMTPNNTLEATRAGRCFFIHKGFRLSGVAGRGCLSLDSLGVIRVMRYIATTDFSQGNKNVLNTPDGGMHIERGRVIDLPFDLPITKLPKGEYLKYSVFFSQQPMLVPIDSEQGKQLVAEIQSAKKLDAEKKRAETARSRPHKYWYERPVGIVLLAAFAAVAAWFVCELIAHHFPHLFHP